MRELTGISSVNTGQSFGLSGPRAFPKVPVVFLIHQVLGTWGVIMAAPWVLAFFEEVGWRLGWKTYISQIMWILYGTPYFTAQLALALVVGWVLGGSLQHRSMLWVWIIPLGGLFTALFGLSFIGAPAPAFLFYPSTANQTIAEFKRMDLLGRLGILFGWGDNIQPFRQVAVTLPFYTAIAYSLGAFLAHTAVRIPAFFESMRNLRIKRLILLVTIPWFCLKFILSWQTVTSKYPILRTWTALSIYFEGLIVVSVFVTFVFAIAVGLIGSQLSLTRFFLSRAEPQRGEAGSE